MLRKIRAGLVTALLFAVTVYLLWTVVEPMVPYLVVGLVLILILGTMYYRKSRW